MFNAIKNFINTWVIEPAKRACNYVASFFTSSNETTTVEEDKPNQCTETVVKAKETVTVEAAPAKSSMRAVNKYPTAKPQTKKSSDDESSVHKTAMLRLGLCDVIERVKEGKTLSAADKSTVKACVDYVELFKLDNGDKKLDTETVDGLKAYVEILEHASGKPIKA